MNHSIETDEVEIKNMCIRGCLTVICKFLLLLLLLLGVVPYLPLS